MIRRSHITAGGATLLCLLLVSLPDAGFYSRYSGAFLLSAVTVILTIISLVMARSGSATRPTLSEILFFLITGSLLTALFWFRARLGLRSDWLVELELIIPAIYGWAWPALLPALLYRRPGEGFRPAGRQYRAWLVATALLAGLVGYLLYLAAWPYYSERDALFQDTSPDTLHHLLIRPTETPAGIALLGGPLHLQAKPAYIRARHPATLASEPVPVSISGVLPFGIRRDLSWQVQGTELESDNPQTVAVIRDDQGRWLLQPRMPGPAIVSIRNRRARGYIGVWVSNRDGEYAPFSHVTDQFTATLGASYKTDGGFYRQTLILENSSDAPVLGPIYAMFHQTDRRVAIAGARRTQRIKPEGIAWFEATKASGSNPALVIAPGQSIRFEIDTYPPLTGEWLHYNMDLIQALTAP